MSFCVCFGTHTHHLIAPLLDMVRCVGLILVAVSYLVSQLCVLCMFRVNFCKRPTQEKNKTKKNNICMDNASYSQGALQILPHYKDLKSIVVCLVPRLLLYSFMYLFILTILKTAVETKPERRVKVDTCTPPHHINCKRWQCHCCVYHLLHWPQVAKETMNVKSV